MYGRNASGPSAQFKPTDKALAWRTECQNAVVVCPERIRPLASVIVPEIMTGKRVPVRAKYFLIAKIAALQFSVSNTVSIIKT